MILRKTYTSPSKSSDPTFEFEYRKETMHTLGIIGGISFQHAIESVQSSPLPTNEVSIYQLFNRTQHIQGLLGGNWVEINQSRHAGLLRLSEPESRVLSRIVDWACSDEIVESANSQMTPLASVVQSALYLQYNMSNLEFLADNAGYGLLGRMTRGGQLRHYIGDCDPRVKIQHNDGSAPLLIEAH